MAIFESLEKHEKFRKTSVDICLVIVKPSDDFSNHFYALSSRANGHQFVFLYGAWTSKVYLYWLGQLHEPFG